MIIKIKYDNKAWHPAALKFTIRMYAYVYFCRFADWFDSKSATPL